MTVRTVISRKLFKKRRALRYPVNVTVVASGAPTGVASTKTGVFVLSVATGGVYAVTGTGTGGTGAVLLVTTGT